MAIRWKVCGITSVEDASAAVAAGADAIGFVFYPPSPRCVSRERAATIAASLPRSTWRVGVFVDVGSEEMANAVEQVGLDFLQLCGDEPPAIVERLPRHAFKVLRLSGQATGAEAHDLADRYPECTLLVDAGVAGEYGGTGALAGWPAARSLARKHRLMLAGGLTAENVGEAIDAVRPWAIDVSSGVESSPGIKDVNRLRAFSRALEPYR